MLLGLHITMDKVAILGWGSLLWCRKNLRNQNAWSEDGPLLPIEFARKSGQQSYLSLVLHEAAGLIHTYWDLSLDANLTDACENLRRRENTRVENIGYMLPDGNGCSFPMSDLRERIHEWLKKRNDIDAVIWTDLRSNFIDGFTVEKGIDWLAEKISNSSHRQAEEYIRMAPSQTQTHLRAIARDRFGWQDTPIGW